MGLRRFALFVAVLAALSGPGNVLAATHDGSVSAEESDRNESEVVHNLWPALEGIGSAGRFYYPAICQPSGLVAFPKIVMRPPRKDKVGLSAIRYIFGKDKGAVVTEDESGIIRITMGKVPKEILRTRISQVRLGLTARYNDWVAIGAIESQKEVQAAMRRLGIQLLIEPTNMPLPGPGTGAPRFPAVLKDVTMDQALDEVATGFDGIVLYGACPKSRVFKIAFRGGQGD